MKFKIEQIALAPQPHRRDEALRLLAALGLAAWTEDVVSARGFVDGEKCENVAHLAFNYEAASAAALELEVLVYQRGDNWIEGCTPLVSHLGMHVAWAEWQEHWAPLLLDGFRLALRQTVETTAHTNPAIAGKRRYFYFIVGTRELIGVDLKFIVRRDAA